MILIPFLLRKLRPRTTFLLNKKQTKKILNRSSERDKKQILSAKRSGVYSGGIPRDSTKVNSCESFRGSIRKRTRLMDNMYYVRGRQYCDFSSLGIYKFPMLKTNGIINTACSYTSVTSYLGGVMSLVKSIYNKWLTFLRKHNRRYAYRHNLHRRLYYLLFQLVILRDYPRINRLTRIIRSKHKCSEGIRAIYYEVESKTFRRKFWFFQHYASQVRRVLITRTPHGSASLDIRFFFHRGGKEVTEAIDDFAKSDKNFKVLRKNLEQIVYKPLQFTPKSKPSVSDHWWFSSINYDHPDNGHFDESSADWSSLSSADDYLRGHTFSEESSVFSGSCEDSSSW